MFVDVPHIFVDFLRIFIDSVDFHNFSVNHAFSLTSNNAPCFFFKKMQWDFMNVRRCATDFVDFFWILSNFIYLHRCPMTMHFAGTHQDPKSIATPKSQSPKTTPKKEKERIYGNYKIQGVSPFEIFFPKGATTYVEAAINSKSDRNM